MLDEYWPLTMLMFLELPSLVTCKLAIGGSIGICFGSPPSNLSDSVALSPTVTVSRSSVAVKLAATSLGGQHPKNSAIKAKAYRSLGWLRPAAFDLMRNSNLRMS